ncbi:choice-of-anchor Q domain-containing protein [Aestuariivirga sp.]|uniref:choice-of-anchor Q domain-containing protein n=1 Tax=Aestuariivirga sp. TaxID=2650926 RepID=UPI0039199C41
MSDEFTTEWRLHALRPAERMRLSRRAFLGGVSALACLAGARPAASQEKASGRMFYVSPGGNDGNDGSEARPFASIGAVFAKIPDLGAGDTVVVMPGRYEEAVTVSRGGDEQAPLTLLSQAPQGALIRSPAGSYSAINVVKSHVVIDGFDVQSGGTGHGIEATFLDGDNRNDGPHHVTIRNNVCHDCPGSGISVSYGDFYLIENNVCFGNCATNEYQGSGISVYAARAVPGEEGVRITVRANTSYANMAIRLPGDVPHSDGNGIIIDDLRNTQSKHPAGSYPHRTLVENNLCHGNGGKGVHVFLSENVTVRNNTCCYNNRDLKNPATWRGELSNVDSNNVLWINNIAVADLSVHSANAAILDASSGGKPSANVVWMRNLTFAGKPGVESITQAPANPTLTAKEPYRNLLGTEPEFVKADPALQDPDFRLRPRSPAVDAGTVEHGIAQSDREGAPRSLGEAPDLGAFETRSA